MLNGKFLVLGLMIFFIYVPLFSYETTYYLHKKSQFELLKSDKNVKIMMLGDSITDRGLWSELMHRCDVVNRGISGDTTEGVLNRLDTLNPNLDRAYIMIGVNDIFLGKGIDDIFDNYLKIINILKSLNINPVIQSTLYVAKSAPSLYNKKIKKLNYLLRKYAERNNIKFIDLNSKLSPHGYLESRYTLDGVHLNGSAYLIWVDMLDI